MTPLPPSRLAGTLRTVAPPVMLALAAAILVRFPPTHYSFYPQCPIHALLGVQCPGCGATRALAALLRGHLAEAIHLNALVTLLVPFAAAYGIVSYKRMLQRKTVRWPQPSPGVLYAALVVITVFTVIRNLPPHAL